MEWRRLELIYGTTLVFGGPVTELRVFWSMLRLHRQPTLIIRHTIWQLQYNCLNTDTDMPGKAGSGGEWYKHIDAICTLQWGSHTQLAPGSWSAFCHAPAAEQESLENWTVTMQTDRQTLYRHRRQQAPCC